jgi:hypothetical protein
MLVVPPTAQKPAEIDRIIAKITGKVKHHNEIAQSIRRVWMPYHRIWISCTQTDTASPVHVVTGLNAFFCPSAKTERELLQLFRPKHLEKSLKKTAAEPTDIICPHPGVDLNVILEKLVKIRTEARDKAAQIESQLVKGYRRMQWRYLVLPTSTTSLERERQTSAKLAELQSRSLAVDICLNLTEALIPRNVVEHDIFYIPMAVVQFRQGRNGSGRYVLIDLATGKLDGALTDLCELNEEFNSRLGLALRSQTSGA